MIEGTISITPVRQTKGKVELYDGSTLSNTFTETDVVKSISIERIGEENKFFGFGICQKANIHLIDIDRVLEPTTANTFKVYFSSGGTGYFSAFPYFRVTETNRDENTNELSITAYDCLYDMSAKFISDLNINSTLADGVTTSYTIRSFAEACASLMGLQLDTRGFDDYAVWDAAFAEGGNFDGTENIREALNDVAEATQSVYYVNDTQLIFKRLDRDGEPIYTIDKAQYFDLDSQTNRRLTKIVSATELGDNVGAEMEQAGTTQYVRDNAFYDVVEDLATWLENAIAAIGGITINQFECSWRGNYLLEVGDKLGLITKDNDLVYSFLLDDKIEYNGALKQSTRWKYTDNEAETASNPTSLGEALKHTYAKVDKINREIRLVASETTQNTQSISAIQLNTNNINASVQKIEKNTNDAIEDLNQSIAELTKRVDLTIDEEQLEIIIQRILENGVDKVVTNTGFRFDDEGLTVSKTGSEMTTLISEDGMQVFKDNMAVLTANNQGVDAVNLHATTYLIIGTNSRFEDYINENYEQRTGCFWIG